MTNLLGDKMEAYLQTHVWDTAAGKPREKSGNDMAWLTQEQFAAWVEISVSTVYHIKKGSGAKQAIVKKVAEAIGLSAEELQLCRAEIESRKQQARPDEPDKPDELSGRTLGFFLLPALHNSLFWTAVLASAVDPLHLPKGDPYYGVVPVCAGESLHRCLDNLHFAHRHHEKLAAVVLSPPAGLPDERDHRDELVDEIEDLFRQFVKEKTPVIVLDRHLPGGATPQDEKRTLSREERAYPEGVVWVGSKDELLAEKAARLLIEEFRRRFGPKGAPIERIAVMIDDARLTPQDRRLFAARKAIEEGLQQKYGDKSVRMSDELIGKGRIGTGAIDSSDRNHWGIVDRIDSLLHQRPYGVICGSSQIAELTYVLAKRRADAGVNGSDHPGSNFVPVIISLDAAGENRDVIRIGYADYRPSDLVRETFRQIREWQGPHGQPGKEVTVGRGLIYKIDEVERAVAALPEPGKRRGTHGRSSAEAGSERL